MKFTEKENIESIVNAQKEFFATHNTRDVSFRIDALKKFRASILKNEDKITDALWKDLHKSYEEAYMSEISIVLGEIDNHIKHLKRWAKPKRVNTPIHLMPSKSKIIYEPLGVALIIAPWNYPFQLLMNPLVGTISAGNCAILKPSEYAENIAIVMQEIINDVFNSEYVRVVQGAKEENEVLLKQKFDIIFFTGSPMVGKVVMRAAAENLTPVILELGGKSPCIVDKDANIDIAAKRIAWGKTLNAGQTCIAPDYLFAHSSIKDELIKKIGENIETMFDNNVEKSKYFVRIINTKAFDRITGLMNEGDIKYGGSTNKEQKYIAPTIIDNVKPDYKIMQQEIFGPVLPVMSFNDIDEVEKYINAHEKPLAFYYFGKSREANSILQKTTSGGACINDTIMHIANHNLPFGGVGNSGLGKYHGQGSFTAFSNSRAVVDTPTWIDLPFKYAPFKYFNITKRLV